MEIQFGVLDIVMDCLAGLVKEFGFYLVDTREPLKVFLRRALEKANKINLN